MLRKDYPGWKLNNLLCILHFLYEFKGGIKAKMCSSMRAGEVSLFQDTANNLILKDFNSEEDWQKKLDEALVLWPCTCCKGP